MKDGEIPVPRNPREQALYNSGFAAGIAAANERQRHGVSELRRAIDALTEHPAPPEPGVSLSDATQLDNIALGLPVDVYTPLIKAGIRTLGDLVSARDAGDLEYVRGIGEGRLRTIELTLARHGRALHR